MATHTTCSAVKAIIKEGKTMTLVELQNILGDRIKITLKDDLSQEERQIENAQTQIIINAAKQMINNGDLILRYEKLEAECKSLEHSRIKEMIG